MCVPGINVCQEVYEIPLPPVPDAAVTSLPRPPRPRDAGGLDAGLVRTRDAEVVDPTDPTPVSHTLFVDVARTVRPITGTSTDTVSVRSYDVQGNPAGLSWRVDQGRPVLEELATAEGDCEVNRFLDPEVLPRPAAFDEVRIDNVVDETDEDGDRRALALDESIVATFDAMLGRYVLTPRPEAFPDPLLTLSELFTRESVYLGVTGDGSPLTASSWPNPEVELHVPFELFLNGDTQTLLSSPVEVGASPAVDLRFAWARVGSGVIANERIVVRIPGKSAELRCVQNEGPNTPGAIRVGAGLLEAFHDAERPEAGARYRLILERATEQQLQVDPRPAATDGGTTSPLRHVVVVRIRHAFEGEIRF